MFTNTAPIGPYRGAGRATLRQLPASNLRLTTSPSAFPAAEHVGKLTWRQRQIMEMVLAGHLSKNIAADLNLRQRTVENHRAQIMRKTGAKSLPALARLALATAAEGARE